MKKIILGITVIVFIACNVSTNKVKSGENYDFSNPNQTTILPDTLDEVSGVAIIDSNTVAFVQDEKGIVFIYDLGAKKIRNYYPFAIDGDYEEITRIDTTMYVLRSDGTIFEIQGYTNLNAKVNSYATGIPAVDNEGLCYDKANNRLLIACKSRLDGRELKDKRAIYAFDLKTKQRSAEPVYNFDLNVIKKFAEDKKLDIEVKGKKKNTGPDIKFKPSAIDIHPIEQKLYLLSAADHLLFIFDLKGNIEHIEVLDAGLYNKAEGLAFFDNGDILITNEAQNKKPTLLRVNHK